MTGSTPSKRSALLPLCTFSLKVFHSRQITVVKKIIFDEFADAKSMANSGLLQELKNSARSKYEMEQTVLQLSSVSFPTPASLPENSSRLPTSKI